MPVSRSALAAVLVPLAGVASWPLAALSAPPNVLLILADDLGYGDVAIYGGDRNRIPTPRLDRLAGEGIRFTDAHATASVCVPSRVALMTGRYAWRYPVPDPAADGPWGYLVPRFPPGTPTLGHHLGRAGYRTAYVGKWHLGTGMTTRDGKVQGPDHADHAKPLGIGPRDHGFAESFILPGSLDMFPYAFVRNHEWVGPVTARTGCSAFGRIGPAAADFNFSTVLERWTEESVAFLRRHAASAPDAPFFLFVALTSPHTPLSPGVAFRGKSALGPYGDLVLETDAAVGRLLDALEETGQAGRTLVVFTSDHGPASYVGRTEKPAPGAVRDLQAAGHHPAGPFRGAKFDLFEGAHRVPFLVRWPGTAAPGTTCAGLVSLVDLFATFAEAAGTAPGPSEAPDSVSFLPLLRDPAGEAPRKNLVTTSSHAWAFRKGPWKLLLTPGSGCNGEWGNAPADADAWRAARERFGRRPEPSDLSLPPFVQLYHLGRDPGETRDVAEEQIDQIHGLLEQVDTVIASGRTTPGDWLENDRPVSYHEHVPPFVLAP
jgi:arylsulfatase A-like enzyme